MNKVAHYNGFVGRCQQYGLTKQAADMLYKQAGAADKAAKEGIGALLKRVLWKTPVTYAQGKINSLGNNMFVRGLDRKINGKADSLLTKAMLSLGDKARRMNYADTSALAKLTGLTLAAPVVGYGAYATGQKLQNLGRDSVADYLNDIDERREKRRAQVQRS